MTRLRREAALPISETAVQRKGFRRHRRLPAALGVAALALGGLALGASAPARALPLLTPLGTVSTYTAGLTGADWLFGMTRGPDGALWFTDYTAGRIGRISTSGTISWPATLPAGSSPYAIVTGPDGALWFTTYYQGAIGRVTTAGRVTLYTAGMLAGTAPTGITVGSDGALWFGDWTGGIGRITTAGVITQIRGAPFTTGAVDLVTGPDGYLWVLETNSRVVLFDPVSRHGDERGAGIAIGAGLHSIAVGADGALWFTESTTDAVGRITASGNVTEYPLALGAQPSWIAAGADGALWFTESGLDTIGRITTRGQVDTFPDGALAGGAPAAIAAGPDGALWFTSGRSAYVGRITTGIPPVQPVPTVVPFGRTILVGWRSTTDEGANPMSSFAVTATPGGAACSAIIPECAITGLNPNVAYRFRVTATNGYGTSVPSAWSAPTYPRRTGWMLPPAASPRAGAATLTWSLPPNNGGNPPLAYTVQAVPGGLRCTTPASVRACTIPGLRNGTTYVFQVTVRNLSGYGPWSAASAPVIAGTPTLPRSLVARYLSPGATRVTWLAPALVNAGPVVGYQVRWTADNGAHWTAWSGVGLHLYALGGGFVRGRAVYVQVRAVNRAGVGPAAQLRFVQGP